MRKELEDRIHDLLLEVTNFNTNDILVNIDEDSRKAFAVSNELTISSAEFPSTILKEASKTEKESGVNPLCLASFRTELVINKKSVQTPVILASLEVNTDKVRQLIHFEYDKDDRFINPFLLRYIERELGVSTESWTVDTIEESLFTLGLSLNKDFKVIANFHHHRYEIVKELESLISVDDYSKTLYALFGHQGEAFNEKYELSSSLLFPADPDHERVISSVSSFDTVIQGPPGTGKSQVITNLIGKLINAKKNIVVISEKHVALEVIQKKLQTIGLEQICYVAASHHANSRFIESLRASWDFFEEYHTDKPLNLMLSEQFEDQLQYVLDLLNTPDLIGGVSFDRFHGLLENVDLSKANYSSDVPPIDHLEEHDPFIRALYDKTLSFIVGKIKINILRDDDFSRIDQKIDLWQSNHREISALFGGSKWGDFFNNMRDAVLYQVYENELYKQYSPIFIPGSKSQKKFLRLYKKYLKYGLSENIAVQSSHWKIQPSRIELNSLEEQLKNNGLYTRLKTRKRWKSISHLPVEKALEAISEERLIQEQTESISQLKLDFCDLDINDPAIDVPLIYSMLQQFSEEQWNHFHSIPEKKRLEYTSNHKRLLDLYHDLKSHFNFDPEDDLTHYFKALKSSLGNVIEQRKLLALLDGSILRSLARNNDYLSLKAETYYSHLTQFKERFPEFSNFSISNLKQKSEEIIGAQNSESRLFVQQILFSIHQTFKRYNRLLNTPARKLSEEEKELKKRLRKGKSILIKEFGKTRRHMSLRELFNSEAEEWIRILKPVWLSNPAQLANSFPMSLGLFDVAIFDEASQIPIQNSLGAIQRSKRVVVAGDDQQMGPASYFSSGQNEVLDLLHQASYYFPKVTMRHHYRSEHPDLIEFSNRHFYDAELEVYPSYARKHPPIVHHFINDAAFNERRNEIEAAAVAARIKEVVHLEESFGIVAFSEEQLNELYQQLDEATKNKLEERLDTGGSFFKALENVQGDECDNLIISFGYGKDENGDFHMRFGPMNTANGRKRLNVLLTRAIKHIDLFCSVRSADFKISDNESVNLIKSWISFFENYQEDPSLQFPFELHPDVNEQTLNFKEIYRKLPKARELVTLHRALKQRGWQVNYS